MHHCCRSCPPHWRYWWSWHCMVAKPHWSYPYTVLYLGQTCPCWRKLSCRVFSIGFCGYVASWRRWQAFRSFSQFSSAWATLASFYVLLLSVWPARHLETSQWQLVQRGLCGVAKRLELHQLQGSCFWSNWRFTPQRRPLCRGCLYWDFFWDYYVQSCF